MEGRDGESAKENIYYGSSLEYVYVKTKLKKKKKARRTCRIALIITKRMREREKERERVRKKIKEDKEKSMRNTNLGSFTVLYVHFKIIRICVENLVSAFFTIGDFSSR